MKEIFRKIRDKLRIHGFRKFLKLIIQKTYIYDVYILRKTYAPFSVYKFYLLSRFYNYRIKDEYKDQLANNSSLNISVDWFSPNMPFWLYFFDKFNFRNTKTNALEIGSWEGSSAYFFLSHLKNSTLTAVDTWMGSEEHKDSNKTRGKNLQTIEMKFDQNLLPFRNRLTKYKGTSFSYFNKNSTQNFFDFIYIDGSHHSDDVILDAIKGFQALKIGGIMIFDDYFWSEYENNLHNPAIAINFFLRLKKGDFKILALYDQLVIQKLSPLPKLI